MSVLRDMGLPPVWLKESTDPVHEIYSEEPVKSRFRSCEGS